ncbi:allatostatin-A receptor-like [Mizuhopecten yessoensis]|uniref:Allatostatin-A receptor n=1 Tax=Mizuhopecten yessoensis TaxID=6573 RepID=A0A210R1H3_MIZYE|nr:allatostatin-A receptor-like [Mizuhopecten yessoensis]OWF54913.1 Allatostatin-A receptor [Mizuhopecten yessoensis]
MTTTWPSIPYVNTSTNYTDKHGYDDPARFASLHAKYITISVSGIIFNVLLVLLILLSKTLRTTPLFWNILNLCLYDSVMVMFVIPFGLDYELNWSWSYGDWMCKMWFAADFWHMLMAGIALTCICADRIFASIQTVMSIRVKTLRLKSIFLVMFPWIFLVTVCIPMFVAFEDKESQNPSTFCFFQFHEKHMITLACISLALPNILLIIAVTIMLSTHILRGGNWRKIPSNRAYADEARLKLSVIAVWVAASINLLCWLPVTCVVFFSIIFESKCKGFTWDEYTNVYLLQVTSSSITPCLWIILPEVRQEVAIWRRFVSKIMHLRSKTSDSLVPSYQSDTYDDETEIQDNTN